MSRIECACCGRKIVAGSPGKGRLWRHDPTERPSEFGDVLVSCTGSLDIVDLPRPGEQLEIDLDLDPAEPEEAANVETMALF